MPRNGLACWIDPRLPIGRSIYFIEQFFAIILAQALLKQIDSIGLRGFSAPRIALTLIGACALFAAMGIVMAKRLLDVGWSRYWTFLIFGPVLLYSLLAVGRSNAGLLRVALIPIVLLFVPCCALIAALFVRPGRNRVAEDLQREG